MLSAHLNTKIRKFLSHFTSQRERLAGFTLIELLVVIVIIGLLTGGAIAAYNNFSRGQTVRRAALELKTGLRESQNRAVSGVKDQTCKQDTNTDNLDDYGLRGHYVTFDVLVANQYNRAQVCESPQGQPFNGTLDEEITVGPENITLSSSVEIDNLRVEDSLGNPLTPFPSILTINFLPLKGVEFYDGDFTFDGSNLISLSFTRALICLSDGQTIYEVYVDLSGQIFEKKVSACTV